MRSSSRRPAATTCCSPVRPAPGKTMLGRRLPSILPPLEPREALEVMRIHSVAGVLAARAAADHAPAVPRAASQRLDRGDRRRRLRAASGRGEPRASRRAARSTSCPSSSGPRSRRCGSRSRTASSRSHGSQGQALFPARFQLVATMNLCPCAGRGDPAAECTCSRAAAGGVPGQALERPPRPLRPGRHGATPSRGATRRRAVRAVGAGRASGSRPVARGSPVLCSGGRRRPMTCSAARSSACRSRGVGGRGLHASREPPRRSPATRRCGRSTSRRRSPTARRRSSPRERARAGLVRGRERRAPRGRAAQRPLRRLQGGVRRSRGARAPARARLPLSRSLRSGVPAAAAGDPRSAAGPLSARERRGELLALPAVAIVGARACSAYGRQIARSVARELAAAGLVVVSGLARGVDAEAHRGALEAGGITVAVLGCGIDRDYPAANRELARQIAASGLVVSEYAPGVEPAPWRFPARNRIVAGLCSALRGRRGPRAQRCLDHGRFRARGGERSLRGSGRDHECALRRLERAAQARRDAADLRPGRARELRARRGRNARQPEVGAAAGLVLARVREAAAGADELARATGLAAEELAVALTELELAGAVTEEGGVYRPAS